MGTAHGGGEAPRTGGLSQDRGASQGREVARLRPMAATFDPVQVGEDGYHPTEAERKEDRAAWAQPMTGAKPRGPEVRARIEALRKAAK